MAIKKLKDSEFEMAVLRTVLKARVPVTDAWIEGALKEAGFVFEWMEMKDALWRLTRAERVVPIDGGFVEWTPDNYKRAGEALARSIALHGCSSV